MGQCSPHVQFFVACLGVSITLGIAATWDGASVFTVGADVGTGAGGIGQSFQVSNRFSEVDCALDQVVPCLSGALDMSLIPCYLHLGGCGSSCWTCGTCGHRLV